MSHNAIRLEAVREWFLIHSLNCTDFYEMWVAYGWTLMYPWVSIELLNQLEAEQEEMAEDFGVWMKNIFVPDSMEGLTSRQMAPQDVYQANSLRNRPKNS